MNVSVAIRISYKGIFRFLLTYEKLYKHKKGGEYMTSTVLGIFSTREAADAAVTVLEKSGYDPKRISLVMRSPDNGQVTTEKSTHVLRPVVEGATAGATIGGIAGILAGLTALTVPGIGALLIAGPIAAGLGITGAAATAVSGGITGVLAGGLVGGLVGMGLPEEIAKIYEDRIKSGGVLVAVATDGESQAVTVERSLADSGADQIKTIELKGSSAGRFGFA